MILETPAVIEISAFGGCLVTEHLMIPADSLESFQEYLTGHTGAVGII